MSYTTGKVNTYYFPQVPVLFFQMKYQSLGKKKHYKITGLCTNMFVEKGSDDAETIAIG